MYDVQEAGSAALGLGQINRYEGAEKQAYSDRMQKLTVRDNIEQQIARAKAEVERLEGIRDRLAPELLDQRIVDLQQAMRF